MLGVVTNTAGPNHLNYCDRISWDSSTTVHHCVIPLSKRHYYKNVILSINTVIYGKKHLALIVNFGKLYFKIKKTNVLLILRNSGLEDYRACSVKMYTTRNGCKLQITSSFSSKLTQLFSASATE